MVTVTSNPNTTGENAITIRGVGTFNRVPVRWL